MAHVVKGRFCKVCCVTLRPYLTMFDPAGFRQLTENVQPLAASSTEDFSVLTSQRFDRHYQSWKMALVSRDRPLRLKEDSSAHACQSGNVVMCNLSCSEQHVRCSPSHSYLTNNLWPASTTTSGWLTDLTYIGTIPFGGGIYIYVCTVYKLNSVYISCMAPAVFRKLQGNWVSQHPYTHYLIQ